jgi:hypothetical protein
VTPATLVNNGAELNSTRRSNVSIAAMYSRRSVEYLESRRQKPPL